MKNSLIFKGITGLALVMSMTGCMTKGDKIELEEKNVKLEQRLSEIQAHLTVLSEQIDSLNANPEPAPVVTLRPAPSNPIVKITDIKPAPPPSKKELLARHGTRYSTPANTSSARKTKKSRKSRKKVSSAKLTRKHIRIAGLGVRDVQLALKDHGCNPGKVDGRLGPNTIRAIKTFQRKEGLKADGIVGRQTWEKLRESPAAY